MLITLLATLWLGIYAEPTHQWEVDTLTDSEQSPKRVEVTKERDSVLCGIVDDNRFVFPPSYFIIERMNILEGKCEQLDEADRDEPKEFPTGRLDNLPKENVSTDGLSTVTETPKSDGQNEQVTQPSVEQPKAEVKSSTPAPTPVEPVAPPVVKEEPKPQPKPQVTQEVVQKPIEQVEQKPTSSSTVVGSFNTSHYTAGCTGCSGITASGYDVRNTIYSPEGYRIVAADPRVLPLGTVIKVTYSNGTSFTAKVMDTGGAIKGNKLDVLVASKDEAYRLGRVTTTVEIVR